MFQKNPICLKKRPICCPYVVLSEGFSSPYVEKAVHMLQNRSPYVAHMQPICGPYVSAAVVKVLNVCLVVALRI